MHCHGKPGDVVSNSQAEVYVWLLQGCQQAPLALSLWSKTVFCTMALATPLDADLAPASV